jgi:hypothetical protein
MISNKFDSIAIAIDRDCIKMDQMVMSKRMT